MEEHTNLLKKFYSTLSHHLNKFHTSKSDLWWDKLPQQTKNKIMRGNLICKKE